MPRTVKTVGVKPRCARADWLQVLSLPKTAKKPEKDRQTNGHLDWEREARPQGVCTALLIACCFFQHCSLWCFALHMGAKPHTLTTRYTWMPLVPHPMSDMTESSCCMLRRQATSTRLHAYEPLCTNRSCSCAGGAPTAGGRLRRHRDHLLVAVRACVDMLSRARRCT